jgi:hypothetical protein
MPPAHQSSHKTPTAYTYVVVITEFRAAPSTVRIWLEQQGFRLLRESPSPERLLTNPATSPPRKRTKPEPQGGTTTHWKDELAPAPVPDKNPTPPEITEADARNAALHKLIAERAYETWENQSRPHGGDLVHWRQAEQEITARIQPPPPPAGRAENTVPTARQCTSQISQRSC